MCHDTIASGTFDTNVEARFYIDIGVVYGNPKGGKQVSQRNFCRSVNVFPEKILQIQSADFLNDRFGLRIGNAAVFAFVKIAAIPVP